MSTHTTPIFGQISGKVGAFVFSKKRGKQVLRAYRNVNAYKFSQGTINNQCWQDGINQWRSLSAEKKRWYQIEAYNITHKLTGFQYFMSIFVKQCIGGNVPCVNADWESISGLSEILNKPIVKKSTLIQLTPSELIALFLTPLKLLAGKPNTILIPTWFIAYNSYWNFSSNFSLQMFYDNSGLIQVGQYRFVAPGIQQLFCDNTGIGNNDVNPINSDFYISIDSIITDLGSSGTTYMIFDYSEVTI
jgi:hypothetical protein